MLLHLLLLMLVVAMLFDLGPVAVLSRLLLFLFLLMLVAVLLVVLHQTLLDLHDIPARHLRALEQRLAELEASSTDTEALSPFFTTAPSARSRAPTTTMSKAQLIAARKNAIR